MPDNPRDRAHIVAAIHGSAAWLAENPQELAPQFVEQRRIIEHADEIDPGLREAAVVSFAERHGLLVERSGTIVWAALDLAAAETHGVRVRYVVVTDLTQPAGWL